MSKNNKEVQQFPAEEVVPIFGTVGLTFDHRDIETRYFMVALAAFQGLLAGNEEHNSLCAAKALELADGFMIEYAVKRGQVLAEAHEDTFAEGSDEAAE